ncbi:MAG: Asp-tRNA(Asn)/Glu-tRNA(Gln) amidotransferase subunit GatC [Armatimonadota bacterium]|nr:Asp-tRNA(Asn)/Glu-tRNA(Gln) amidotransferase subunit GatC [Armatimonadota bacterium]MDR7532461.1 Asp-tRNA(Asn)/Glu-tRNA(Gln) amidotransferase subunit GatC [Armatimonadota bacterium]MDR7535684.1 Asp-tRNA(Asn)/Glu-tRNA(Gln) amidotransferase subunit GatC [Armatimonadota bacterium]
MIDHRTVDHVARLARLALSPEERERFAAQLGRILEYIARLDALDLADVPPTSHVVPMVNVFRADVVTPSLPRDEVLGAAPAQADGFFVVPRVLDVGAADG